MMAQDPELTRREAEMSDDSTSSLFSNRRRCHFRMPCLGSRRPRPSESVWWTRMRSAEIDDAGWWARGVSAVKKLREWSELIAGPKWKTFIRRFNKNIGSCSGGGGCSGVVGGGGGGSKLQGKFQYDPLGYALNFDDGPGQNRNFDEDYLRPTFSARFASVPESVRPSVDLGRNPTVFA
ncbi:uncharacterized protein LOC131145984 [Malania oleifera]|uniref:uncharacterized protein LOC131145984 n=1 Tax=Malania oleifera TaxID=397392 RepID=UPI0025ADEC76|nr:uncharacterized protein LOC131145984 [Malania oleifera]